MWHGLVGAVTRALDGWQPGPLTSERACKDALHRHLAAMIPEDCHVEREYRHAGTTADLHLAWQGVLFTGEVFFELKRNLMGKSEYDRLVGQIEGLRPRDHKLVVALFGKTNPDLLGRLRHHYRDYSSRDEQSMAIVTFGA